MEPVRKKNHEARTLEIVGLPEAAVVMSDFHGEGYQSAGILTACSKPMRDSMPPRAESHATKKMRIPSSVTKMIR